MANSERARGGNGKKFALILFTKVPKPGLVKTRFIDRNGGLSKEVASALYLCLLQDTLTVIADLAKRIDFSLIVSFAPRNGEHVIRSIVAPYVGHANYVPQTGSSVTQKVRNAFNYAFDQGYRAISLIPGDHADLDCDLLAQSFERLVDSGREAMPSAVLGPTCDGGAYLLGFNREGFSRIRFDLEDTFMVCVSIVRSARQRGIRYAILDNRSDIDDWEDMQLFLRQAQFVHTKTYSFLRNLRIPSCKSAIQYLSIIIPTLNEEGTISNALASLESQTDRGFEIVLVDGNSSDSTLDRAWKRVDKFVFVGRPARKRQENIGAMGAKGDTLLFMHADMILSRTITGDVARSLKDPLIIGGSSRITFDGAGPRYRLLDALRNCGSQLLRIHGISSAFFVRRSMFFAVRGFREDVMEEAVDMSRRLAGYGRFITLSDTCTSSARRFKKPNFGLVAALWVATVFLTVLGLNIAWVENKLWRSLSS